MKHRVLTILLTVFVVLALVSCDFMYETNFFATEMSVSAAELAETSLEDLSDKAGSPKFFEALAADPLAKAAVLTNLDEVIADPDSTPEEVAEASLLAAEVLISTTPAGELIANVGSLVLALASSTEGDEGPDMSDPESLLTELLPEGMVNESGEIDEESFVEMINALYDSYDYFVSFSESMDPNDYTSGELGDTAMTAMMASIIVSIETPDGFESQGEFLYALLTGAYEGEVTMAEMGTDSNLSDLFEAAGLAALIGGAGAAFESGE